MSDTPDPGLRGKLAAIRGPTEAKEFLVARIVEEATRLEVSLSDLERKMLYFSEQYATLTDMAEIDAEIYEAKIARLSRSAYRRDKRKYPETVKLWRKVVRILQKENHYLLAIIDLPRSPLELWKLAVVVSFFLLIGVGAVGNLELLVTGFAVLAPDLAMFLALALFAVTAHFFASNDQAWENRNGGGR